MQNLFLSLSQKTFMKISLSPKTAVSNHSSFCQVENCKIPLVIIGLSHQITDQFLQRLDKNHFTYQSCWLFPKLLHQEAKVSINWIGQSNTIWNVEYWKNYPVLQRNSCCEKSSKDIISVLIRSLRPLRLLDQLFWKDSKNSKLKVWDWFVENWWLFHSWFWYCK